MLPGRVNLIQLRAKSSATIERLRKAGVEERKFFAQGKFMGPEHSAHWGNFLLYGTPFIDSFHERKIGDFSIRLGPAQFESPVAVTLFSSKGKRLFSAKLGFEEGSVLVEAFQGVPVSDWRSPDARHVARWVRGRHGTMRQFDVPVNRSLVEFGQFTSVPAPNYIMREIENSAKAQGYGEVRIRRPETLTWYRYYQPRKGWADMLEHMRKLYYGVAAAEHYRKAGAFLVKKL